MNWGTLGEVMNVQSVTPSPYLASVYIRRETYVPHSYFSLPTNLPSSRLSQTRTSPAFFTCAQLPMHANDLRPHRAKRNRALVLARAGGASRPPAMGVPARE